MMRDYRVVSDRYHTDCGIYEADSADEALNQFALAMGANDYADLMCGDLTTGGYLEHTAQELPVITVDLVKSIVHSRGSLDGIKGRGIPFDKQLASEMGELYICSLEDGSIVGEEDNHVIIIHTNYSGQAIRWR